MEPEMSNHKIEISLKAPLSANELEGTVERETFSSSEERGRLSERLAVVPLW